MNLTVDPGAAEPPFEQVRAGIIGLIAAGELIVGVRLPTVRALASQLSIAPNTVARAYRELEAAGVIETRGRRGTFVKAQSDSAMTRAEQLTVEHVQRLRELGIGDADIASMVAAALHAG
ncbi:GntR family transcriptional regulator [Williamsia sp. CHRR-6]|uniref:GntR family transcriptional regulator n=1 Tax=Williamsia sp. CHRR-6 TaxID=2835871 RepID=UPI001BDA95F2|nr:GntR family transcriptional regulator [Williamsia sp. CHRR-6]MBT0566643.1 GntR family transcriptional regulator [Williamsia sp. CHRR-6]